MGTTLRPPVDVWAVVTEQLTHAMPEYPPLPPAAAPAFPVSTQLKGRPQISPLGWQFVFQAHLKLEQFGAAKEAWERSIATEVRYIHPTPKLGRR